MAYVGRLGYHNRESRRSGVSLRARGRTHIVRLLLGLARERVEAEEHDEGEHANSPYVDGLAVPGDDAAVRLDELGREVVVRAAHGAHELAIFKNAREA
eukprot:637835-Pleurochrysis_carterae.AAC.5